MMVRAIAGAIKCRTASSRGAIKIGDNMKAELFRTLDKTEEQEFRQWARDNFSVTEPIKSIWHPSIQDECIKMINEFNSFWSKNQLISRR